MQKNCNMKSNEDKDMEKTLFYAYEGGITTDPDKGKLEITQDEYVKAAKQMLEGKTVTVKNNIFKIIPYIPPVPKKYILKGELHQTYSKIPKGALTYTPEKWYINDEGKYVKIDDKYKAEVEKQQIINELNKVDSIVTTRLIRDAFLGNTDALSKIKEAEKQAEDLRAKLASLNAIHQNNNS